MHPRRHHWNGWCSRRRSAANHRDVAAIHGDRGLNPFEPAMCLQCACCRIDLRSPGCGPRAGHDCQLVEDQGGVFDEHRVGQVIGGWQISHLHTETAQQLDVLTVLGPCEVDVDDLAVQKRQLTVIDGVGNLTDECDFHARTLPAPSRCMPSHEYRHPMIEQDSVRRFLAEHSKGVLTTLKRDGRPQMSNIVYGFFDERVHVSVSENLAKTRNATRDPRVSLHVTNDNFGRYLVVEGVADVSSLTVAPDDETAELLVRTYRSIAGEHPDWDEYRDAMIQQRRVVISFGADHAYGQGVE